MDRFYNADANNDSPLITDDEEKPGDYLGGDYAGVRAQDRKQLLHRLGRQYALANRSL